ncbi:phosphatidylglycerol lysyltransferase domain-containing protein, partial [Acinetobacter baumannii]
MQTPPEFVPIYEEQHLNVLKVGEDGVVDLEKFCKTTSSKKTFKGAVKKLDKAGYQVTRCVGPHSETDLNELQAVSDEWLSL